MSTATVKALTNGQAKENDVKEGATLQVTPPAPPSPKDKKAPELLPLDDRLHRLNILFDLQKQYNAAQKYRQKLQEFMQEGDDESLTLTFSDDERNELQTKHPRLTKAVFDFVQDWMKNEMQGISDKIIL